MSKNLPATTGRWVEPPKKAQIKLNLFDRFIGYFNPKALLKRKKARIYNDFIERKYEASDAGRRTAGWSTNNMSANAETSIAQTRVRDRSRDLIRNNPYAARAVQVVTNNVVGKGIKTQLKADTRSGSSNKEKKLNEVWRAWAETTECDFERVHTFAGLQRLVMRSVFESGEVFVRIRKEKRRIVEGPDGKLVEIPPFSLQVLEADFVSPTRTGATQKNGNKIVQGIEFDKNGKKVFYHMYLEHPGGNDTVFGSRFQTVKVPANEVLHLFRMDRPGQSRGMPWLAPVVLRLRDFDLYEDAQLKRQQVASMFTAFIHDIEGIDDTEETEEEMELGEKMEPGLMEILPPGKDVKLSNPPGADNYREYTSVVLHSIASALGLTYYQLTGDLAEINFSAGRLGFLETQRNFESWQQNIMINQFLKPIFQEFKDGLDLIGQNISGVRAVHTPPRREMIDPTKETSALVESVRSGLKSQSQAVRELGQDPDTHFEEIQKDNERLDELGLVFDSDPRKTDKAGKAKSEGDAEESSDFGNDE